jgi:predicted transcriptional regulator
MNINIEEEVLCYLIEFGDTREADMVNYLKQVSDVSERVIRTHLAKMIRKEKIREIVHVKLKPRAVYLTRTEHVPLEVWKELLRAQTEFEKAEFDYYARVEAARARNR